MSGISYGPTDLSLLKGFSKNFSFEDFQKFQKNTAWWPRLDDLSKWLRDWLNVWKVGAILPKTYMA